jgi:hypothetical protein
LEDARRWLSGMLPGAEIAPLPGGDGFVALVSDLDRPIPVLVERGRYTYPAAAGSLPGRRVLVRGPSRLVLVDSRAEFDRLTAAG